MHPRRLRPSPVDVRRLTLRGRALRVLFRPDPRAWRGKLFSGGGRGVAVHAGSHIRRRLIVLDTALVGRWRELRRILVHEIFHFVWVRLGNRIRRSWERVLEQERQAHARGDLGWSSEVLQQRLSPRDWRQRTRRWREYCCEAFCDTAAWLCAESHRHREFTLAKRWRKMRHQWFVEVLSTRELAI